MADWRRRRGRRTSSGISKLMGAVGGLGGDLAAAVGRRVPGVQRRPRGAHYCAAHAAVDENRIAGKPAVAREVRMRDRRRHARQGWRIRILRLF